MALTVASFNTDWTRRASVGTKSKLVGVLTDYTVEKMKLPAAIALCEVTAGVPAALGDALGSDTWDCINEKVGYDNLALLWDANRLEKRELHMMSDIGKYIVVPFNNRDTGETIVIACAHLPFKRKARRVGESVLDRAHTLLHNAIEEMVADHKATQVVVHGDLNTQPAALAEKHPDYTLALTDGDISTCHNTCPDNVMVWTAEDNPDIRHRIYNRCPHFDHFPIWAEIS